MSALNPSLGCQPWLEHPHRPTEQDLGALRRTMGRSLLCDPRSIGPSIMGCTTSIVLFWHVFCWWNIRNIHWSLTSHTAACSTPILIALLFSKVGREIKSEINAGERLIEYPDLGFHLQIKYIKVWLQQVHIQELHIHTTLHLFHNPIPLTLNTPIPRSPK